MGMKETLGVLNAMEADGVISRYAIAGAVAAYNYIEPTLTEDLDILVYFGEGKSKSALVSLAPIFSYLKKNGYAEHIREGVAIGGWPVQFLPVASPLDEEALQKAKHVKVRVGGEDVLARVLLPEHIVATAVSVGRPKDLSRIDEFLRRKAVNVSRLCKVLTTHGLHEKWSAICRRLGVPNPCA